jgi:hypothetical protein
MGLQFFGRAVSLAAIPVAVAVAGGAGLGACGSSDSSTTGSSPFPAAQDDAGGGTPSYDGGGLAPGLGPLDAGAVSLAFDPPQATLTLDGTTPQSATFSLKATYADGHTAVVTPDALQFDRPDLAKMTVGSPVTLAAPGTAAGVGTLHGIFGAQEATAQLTVIVHVVDATGIDPGVKGALDGATAPDPALTSLLYPYDKTLFPLGLASPLLMWTAPGASDVYRVHLEEKNYTFDGYYAVPQPAQKAVDQAVWDRLTSSNAGDPLKVTLSRYDAAASKAYVSASQSWTVVPASLRGAIYYWTTSNGGHMSRIRPGQGAQPEVLNGGKCMGCHAVSADGTTLVAAVDGDVTNDGSGDNRAWVSFGLPGATATTTSTFFAGNVAVNPNGKYVVFGDQKLKLGDTATGQVIANSGMDTLPLDPGMLGFMTPAFSPDGKHVAMVTGKQGAGKSNAWYHNLYDGNLVVVDFDEATQKVSNLVKLAPASGFPATENAIAYPSFAPDSKSIAFHVGDYTTGCDNNGCDDAAKQIGALWMQDMGSGAAPVRLTTLTDSSASAADHDLSLEPTFNPVARGGYHWVVFTSSRDWGNRITGTANNGKKRLWVAAVDETWTGAADPSHPAFFLQGQEEGTTNMRGFWALAQCTPTPAAGAGGGVPGRVRVLLGLLRRGAVRRQGDARLPRGRGELHHGRRVLQLVRGAVHPRAVHADADQVSPIRIPSGS